MFKFNKENIKGWAQKYDNDYDCRNRSVEDRLKRTFENQRYLTQDNLYDILNWKSPRIRRYARENDPPRILRITQDSFATQDERIRIESLLGQRGGLRGIGYPVASTILHFAFPNKYPIMDFRVIRSLCLEQPSPYTFNFWEAYCQKMSALSRKYGLCIRTVEKALWKFDKDRHPRKNKCQRCNQ